MSFSNDCAQIPHPLSAAKECVRLLAEKREGRAVYIRERVLLRCTTGLSKLDLPGIREHEFLFFRMRGEGVVAAVQGGERVILHKTKVIKTLI